MAGQRQMPKRQAKPGGAKRCSLVCFFGILHIFLILDTGFPDPGRSPPFFCSPSWLTRSPAFSPGGLRGGGGCRYRKVAPCAHNHAPSPSVQRSARGPPSGSTLKPVPGASSPAHTPPASLAPAQAPPPPGLGPSCTHQSQWTVIYESTFLRKKWYIRIIMFKKEQIQKNNVCGWCLFQRVEFSHYFIKNHSRFSFVALPSIYSRTFFFGGVCGQKYLSKKKQLK